MDIETVIRELDNGNGEYLRGDSEIRYSVGADGRGTAQLNLSLKDPSLIAYFLPDITFEMMERIEYPTLQDIQGLTDLQFGIDGDKLTLTSIGKSVDDAVSPLVKVANDIRGLYPDVHITRRAGAYALIVDGVAIYSTDSLIKHCPLAENLFTREGYDDSLIGENLLRELNEQAIGEFGMFTGKRSLRACEAAVTFGASEMTADAIRNGYIDSAVLVCDGVGTVVTYDAETSEGVGGVMTGTFYTTPIDGLIETCYDEGIFVVSPETAEINQLKGLVFALRSGKKDVVVSVAADDAEVLPQMDELARQYGANVYKFALCSTGIDEKDAGDIAKYSDIVWSCASKNVRDIVSPKSLLQVGLKIPVYIMNEGGLGLAKHRLEALDPTIMGRLDGLDLYKDNYFIARDPENRERLVVDLLSNVEGAVDTPRPLV